ncbi:MAG: tyrosine-type recombinase/integrase [Promethearchaeota archaeon]
MRSNNRIRDKYFGILDEELQSGLEKQSTSIQRKKAVNYFVNFLNSKQIKLKEISDEDIHSFIQYLSQKRTNRGRTLTSSTIKQIYALSKIFYIRCYEKRVLTQPPDRIFTINLLKRYKIGEHKLPKYIDQKKMRQLLEECRGRWKALLHFMYETGARISEVLNIQLDDVDYERKVVQIYEPKTNNYRITALSEKTIQLIKEYKQTYRRVPRPGYESYLFINQQRRKMSKRAIQFLINRLSSKLWGENNKISPHYFRAACAVHLLEEGVDIRQVQEIIGWKSLSVVQNYTRVTLRRQTELKKEFHPSFRKTKLENQKQAKPTLHPDIAALMKQMKEEQQQMREELQKNRQKEQERQQEIHELKQKERLLQNQVNELIENQKNLIKMLSGKQS